MCVVGEGSLFGDRDDVVAAFVNLAAGAGLAVLGVEGLRYQADVGRSKVE